MSDYTDPFTEAVQLLTATLRAACNDPADQIRLLMPLAAFTPPDIASRGAQATAAVCRRSALAELARAVSDYQPTSSTDAEGVLEEILPLFAAEIVYAADMGDNETYYAMRSLRATVTDDLQTRSINLPELIEMTWPSNQPALVIAYELYADATREQDLLARNPEVISANFMPLEFEVLSR